MPDNFMETFQPIPLLADGTLEPRAHENDRLAYETAATLALIAGGEWKRGPLQYVAWSRVRRTLQDEGRGALAELFDDFFRGRQYADKLPRLLEKVGESDWGFEHEWVHQDGERYAATVRVEVRKDPQAP